MVQLGIVRVYFDEIVEGVKTKEFRDNAPRMQTVAKRKHILFKNGRSNKDPYVVVQLLGSSVSSLEEVQEHHGTNALKHFKTNDIIALHLGKVLEVWDPKKKRYSRAEEADAELGDGFPKTTTPTRHSSRDGLHGPLPVDLNIASLQRRDVARLPQQSLVESFSAVREAMAELRDLASKDGHHPLLWQDTDIRVGSRFTGLGSAEEALCILQPHVQARFRYVYGCDTSDDARKFFRARFSKDKGVDKDHHWFEDVLDLVQHGPVPDKIFNMPFQEKVKAISDMDMLTATHCKIHRKKCPVPQVELDISGSVCKDYSAQGKRSGTDGRHVVSMLLHFQDLHNRKVPIRISENVVSPEAQMAISQCMRGCDVRYIITMPEDVGHGCVRRDRGWLAGVSPPYRLFQDPNVVYKRLSDRLSARQVPQDDLWFEDAAGLKEERKKTATQFRKFTPKGSLRLGPFKRLGPFNANALNRGNMIRRGVQAALF